MHTRDHHPQRNDEALHRFMTIVIEIRETLAPIQAAADDHFYLTPEEIHWGHVGDAQRTLEGLNEILATIRGQAK